MNWTSLIWEASLKGAILLAAAWIAALLCRRASADLRHRVWAGALAGMALLLIPIPKPETLRLSVAASNFVNGAPRMDGEFVMWQTWAVWIWTAGAALVALKIAAGVVRLWILTRRARHESDAIHVSGATATPLTWGAFRPVILLPEYAARWTPEQRTRAIHHEQAHIARHDWAWQLFAQAMTSIFWFHPLVWLAASSLRREADLAADNAVLAAGEDAATYATQLLEVARMFQGPRYAAGVSMVRTPAIEGRIRSILNPSLGRKPASSMARLGVAMAALALLLPMAAYQAEEIHKGTEPGMKPPAILKKVDPDYTEKAKDEQIQGTVVLQMVVGSNGYAHDIVVTRPLFPGLNENAVDAVSKWVFKPAEKDGKPVAMTVTIEVNFKLQ